MAKKCQVCIYLPSGYLHIIDLTAKNMNVSRSEVVRQAIKMFYETILKEANSKWPKKKEF